MSQGTNDSILVGIIIFIIVVIITIIIIIIIRCHLTCATRMRTVRTTDFHVELTVELKNG